ncbi:MAG: transketolase family protein [Fusobacteriaceae bacterium]|jgi:transketolase|nr:transketolase family protein [Fusobacteriaceae bacterium]
MEELREVFARELIELGKEFPNLYVIDADLKTSTRTVLFEDAYPRRFIQAGIAEQNMVGIAAGLALEGKIPIVCTFANFLASRALDQVYTSVAYPGINVKFAGAYSGILTGKLGATHQAIEDLAVMRGIPGLRIAAPADSWELRSVMRKSVEYNGPVYFRVDKNKPELEFTMGFPFEWGKGHEILHGTTATLIGTGIASRWAFEAASALHEEGINVRFLHMPSIKPFDDELVLKAAKETGILITIENHSIIGGLGGAVCEVACREQPAKVVRLGVKDMFCETGSDVELQEEYNLTAKDITKTVKSLLK